MCVFWGEKQKPRSENHRARRFRVSCSKRWALIGLLLIKPTFRSSAKIRVERGKWICRWISLRAIRKRVTLCTDPCSTSFSQLLVEEVSPFILTDSFLLLRKLRRIEGLVIVSKKFVQTRKEIQLYYRDPDFGSCFTVVWKTWVTIL